MKRHRVSVKAELQRIVPLNEMPPYSIGIVESVGPYAGTLIIRGFGSYVTALDGSMCWTWDPSWDEAPLPRVRLLPPGTKIEIEVGA